MESTKMEKPEKTTAAERTVMEKPAIEGGTPVRKEKINYGHQYIDEADIALDDKFIDNFSNIFVANMFEADV